MSSTRVAVTFISVQDAKPNYSYENPQYPPLEHLHSRILVRATMPSLPAGSTITSAKLRVNQTGTWSGSNTLFAQRNFASWTNKATWNTKPALGDTAHSQTQSGTTPGTWWEIDVTADVQGFLAGTKNNWGWSLYTTSTTRRNVRGSTSPTYIPYLFVEYELPAKTPTDLSPQGGAVSVAKPVLTFTTGGSTVAVQVQIDATQDAVSPGFDSGTVAATAGVLDLSATAYAGLADGSTTSWRARHQTSYGWSAWSAWVTFSRADLESLSLDNPGTTSSDPTPPFEWTFGGTQTAWQADLTSADAGRSPVSSGRVSGAETAWTPPASPRGAVPTVGSTGTARIRVWDDVVRVATPGAPTYSEDTVVFSVAFDGTVDPMDTLIVSQTPDSPGVILAGTRAAGTPDEVGILRDGVLVARLVGTDVFTGTAFAWTDWSAPMNVETTYTVTPIVNGAFADGGPTVTVTPKCKGLWLVNSETDVAAVLWGQDPGQWARADIATEHRTTDGNIVRRRLSRPPVNGTISGDIINALAFDAQDVVDALETFAVEDAGTTYRLIAGRLNLEVIVGNILVTPTPMEGSERYAAGQFDWWGV